MATNNFWDEPSSARIKQRRADEMPKHCSKCGKKLNRVITHLGFDTKDGQELLGTKLVCYTWGIFPHFEVNYDENNYEIIERYP